MSWAEVKKINGNMAMPINEQLRELSYAGSYLLTSGGTFSPDKTGWYKIIVVSRGGNSYYSESKGGSSGAVAIKTLHLQANEEYPIVVDNANKETSFSSFNNEIICYNATNSSSSGVGIAGVATGGDFNYNGLVATSKQGKDVGVFIPQLMKSTRLAALDGGEFHDIVSGDGILGYGCGCTSYGATAAQRTENKGGCILVMPLELES